MSEVRRYHSRLGGTRIMQSIAHTISGELRAKLQSAEFWKLRTKHLLLVLILKVMCTPGHTTYFFAILTNNTDKVGYGRVCSSAANGRALCKIPKQQLVYLS